MGEVRDPSVEEVGENVRVCRICGSPNPQDDTNYCNNCWLPLARAELIPKVDAESRFYRRGHRLLRNKPLFFALAVVVGLVLWQVLVTWDVFYLLAPSPKPSSAINADAGPGSWAQAGGTPQNSAFTPETAPVPGIVAWTFSVPPARSQPAPPRMISPPAVAGQRVFVTTEDGRTIALEKTTGEVLWEYHSGLPSTTTPAVAGGLVIFSVRPGQVFALAKDSGELRWQADLGSTILAAPSVAKGRVYVGTADNNLYALDAANGSRLWGFTAGSWIVTQVALADDTVVVTSIESDVYVLDAETGRERFAYNTGHVRNLYGTASILDDIAYIPSNLGMLWAVKRDVTNYPLERRIWGARTKMAVWWSLWNPPVQPGTVWASHMGGQVIRSPATAHDKVYASVKDRRVIALDAKTGDLSWESHVGADITTGPVVAGNTVLVGTKTGIVAGLNAESGEVAWEFKIGDAEITSRPIVSNGLILAAARDGKLYALSAGE